MFLENIDDVIIHGGVKMKTLAYYNGEITEIADMKVPLNDRAMFYGDGVYDATFAHNHVIWALEDHIERFYNSAALLDIVVPMGKAELSRLLEELVARVESPEQFVYWSVTRGTAPRSHEYPVGVPANLIVTLTPTGKPDTAKKVKLISYEDHRFEYCNIKTLNLIPSVLAAEAAKKAGCDEVIFHRGDIVTECAHSNCHIIKDGKLLTHPADHHILPGIGRAYLIKAAKAIGMAVDETCYTLDELRNADEVLVTASSRFCLQAVELDGKPVGGKAPELVKKLQEYRINSVEEECKAR